MSRYLDVHVIQSVPYACLNRDDTGAPKSAMFGGALRTRVSSQSWKRAMRLALQEALEKVGPFDRDIRTVGHAEYLASILAQRGMPEEDALYCAMGLFKSHKKAFPDLKNSENTESTGEEEHGNGAARVAFYLTESQYQSLAGLAEENKEALLAIPKAQKGTRRPGPKELPSELKGRLDDILREEHGLIRLFGRMIAQIDRGNTDSAIQVAHALTTHESAAEIDYTTAVDDSPAGDSRGAMAIVYPEYASGTFYRYATINLDTLAKNGVRNDELPELVAAATKAFIESVPTGKQSSTAAYVKPGFVHVALRDSPENLVGAFEKPVWSVSGHFQKSVHTISEYTKKSRAMFGELPRKQWVACLDNNVDGLDVFGEQISLPELISRLSAEL